MTVIVSPLADLRRAQEAVERYVPGEGFLNNNFTLTAIPSDQASPKALLNKLIVYFDNSQDPEKWKRLDLIIKNLQTKIVLATPDLQQYEKIQKHLKTKHLLDLSKKLYVLHKSRKEIQNLYLYTAQKVWLNFYLPQLKKAFPGIEAVNDCLTCHFLSATFLKKLTRSQLGIAALGRIRSSGEKTCQIAVRGKDLAWLRQQLAEIPEHEHDEKLLQLQMLMEYIFSPKLFSFLHGKIGAGPLSLYPGFFETCCPDFACTITKMKKIENQRFEDPLVELYNLGKELAETQKSFDEPYRNFYREYCEITGCISDKSLPFDSAHDANISYSHEKGIYGVPSPQKFESDSIRVVELPVKTRRIPVHLRDNEITLNNVVIGYNLPEPRTSLSTSSSSSSALAYEDYPTSESLSSEASVSSSSSSDLPSCSSSALASASIPSSVSLSSTISAATLSSPVSSAGELPSCSSSALASASTPSSVSLSSSSSSPAVVAAAPFRVSSNFSRPLLEMRRTLGTPLHSERPSPFCIGTSPIKKYAKRVWKDWQPLKEGRIKALARKGYAEAGPLKKEAGVVRHTFTKFVDRFVGGPYSLYVPPSEEQPTHTYLIYGEIQWTDRLGKPHVTRGQFSYGINDAGVCFHRYLTQRTTDQIAEEFLNKRSAVDYPSLTKSLSLYQTTAKDLREIEITTTEEEMPYRLGPLDTISFRDEENEWTITLFKLE